MSRCRRASSTDLLSITVRTPTAEELTDTVPTTIWPSSRECLKAYSIIQSEINDDVGYLKSYSLPKFYRTIM
jgi:hypothetical protein